MASYTKNVLNDFCRRKNWLFVYACAGIFLSWSKPYCLRKLFLMFFREQTSIINILQCFLISLNTHRDKETPNFFKKCKINKRSTKFFVDKLIAHQVPSRETNFFKWVQMIFSSVNNFIGEYKKKDSIYLVDVKVSDAKIGPWPRKGALEPGIITVRNEKNRKKDGS